VFLARSRGKRRRWLAAGLAIVVSIPAVVLLKAPSELRASTIAATAQGGAHSRQSHDIGGIVHPSPAGRIVYPAGGYPTMTLPDGQQRTIRSLLDVTKPLRFGDYAWNDAGVPAGPIWIRVDLSLQTLSVFREGHEIGTTLILYGADGKPTPLGVYPILERAKQHRSTLYDAEMPYMLRLTPDGVAIHASAVRAAAATHGCIGVPRAFARLLFAQARRGDRVAITASR
jgi:hypothetical protein